MSGMCGGVLLGRMNVGSWCFDYVRGVFTLWSSISIVGRFISGCPNLTTLTSPDEVGLTSTARLLVLLEA